MLAGEFSIFLFYERRARRILPALFTVIFASILVGAVLLTPEEMSNLALSVVAAVLFVQNFFMGAQAGYFDAASETKPLLHIWSLAVEEQFYIFFPPLLWLFARWLSPRALLGLIFMALSLSLAASIMLMHRPVLNFYMLPLRAWEMLTGSALAILDARSRLASANRLRDVLSLVGLAAILLPALLYTADMPFPGYTAFPPVAGAAALIWAGERSLAGRFLSWKPLVGIGLISYSLYLWHWPVIAFHALVFPGNSNFWHALTLFGVSVTLSILSWRYIENPFRHRDGFWSNQRRVFLQSGLAMVASIGLAAAILEGNGWPWRASSQSIAIAQVAREKNISDQQCRVEVFLFTLRDKKRGFCKLGAIQTEGSPVVIWGDSHVGAWYPMLDAVFRAAGIPAVAISMSGCPIAFGLERADPDKAGCREAANAIRAYIEKENVEKLLIVGSWFGVMTSKNTVYNGQRSYDDVTRAQNITQALADTGDTLHSMGVKTAFLMTAPGAKSSVPEALFRKAQLGDYPDIRRTLDNYERAIGPIRAVVAEHFDAKIETADLLCSRVYCRIIEEGKPLYYDSNHPSLYLNELLLPQLRVRFEPFLGTGEPRQ